MLYEIPSQSSAYTFVPDYGNLVEGAVGWLILVIVIDSVLCVQSLRTRDLSENEGSL